MKVSTLIENLNEYLEFYGDKNVVIYYRSNGEDLEIAGFDAFKDEFNIEVQDFEDNEE